MSQVQNFIRDSNEKVINNYFTKSVGILRRLLVSTYWAQPNHHLLTIYG